MSARNMELNLAKIWGKQRPQKLPHEYAYTGRSGAGELVYPPRPSTPPNTYVAKAVNFDGATSLTNAALTAVDSNFLALSFWIKIANPAGAAPVPWSTDPAGTLPNETFFEDDGAGSWKIWQNVTAAYAVNTDTYPVAQSTWAHVLVGVDGSGTTKTKIYVNDVDIAYSGAAKPPFVVALAGLPMTIGTDLIAGDYMIGDFADFWFGNSNILDGGGDIPLATRRKFIDANGKPVDPTNFPAGLVLLSGDATTFATNQGSGGAFTTTGTLTNASTSPST